MIEDELAEALDSLEYRCQDEGIEYALVHYSNWNELEPLAPDLYEKIVKVRESIADFSKLFRGKYGRSTEWS